MEARNRENVLLDIWRQRCEYPPAEHFKPLVYFILVRLMFETFGAHFLYFKRRLSEMDTYPNVSSILRAENPVAVFSIRHKTITVSLAVANGILSITLTNNEGQEEVVVNLPPFLNEFFYDVNVFQWSIPRMEFSFIFAYIDNFMTFLVD